MVSKRYLRFDSELRGIVKYAKANQKRLAISAQSLTRLETALQAWDKAFKRYVDASTRTSSVVQQVGDNYKTTLSYLRRFQKMLKSNVDLSLTGPDYIGLHIQEPKPRRQRIPRPTLAPELKLLNTSHLANKFQIKAPQLHDQNRRGFPEDVSGAGRKLALVATDESPTESDFRPLSNTTRVLFTLTFEPARAGQKGVLIAWYVNRRGEMGPESEPLEFMII